MASVAVQHHGGPASHYIAATPLPTREGGVVSDDTAGRVRYDSCTRRVYPNAEASATRKGHSAPRPPPASSPLAAPRPVAHPPPSPHLPPRRIRRLSPATCSLSPDVEV